MNDNLSHRGSIAICRTSAAPTRVHDATWSRTSSIRSPRRRRGRVPVNPGRATYSKKHRHPPSKSTSERAKHAVFTIAAATPGAGNALGRPRQRNPGLPDGRPRWPAVRASQGAVNRFQAILDKCPTSIATSCSRRSPTANMPEDYASIRHTIQSCTRSRVKMTKHDAR